MKSMLPMPTAPTLCSSLLFPFLVICLDVEFLVVKVHETSDGGLNQSFKFGGLRKFDAEKQKETRRKRGRADVIQYHTPA